MKSRNVKLRFIITILVCWSTLSMADDIDISTEFPYQMDEILSSMCQEDMVSLHTTISHINQDFMSGSQITCLDLSNNQIQRMATGAFGKLPNLTNLYLSNNNFESTTELFNFGSHEKLKVLVLDNTIQSRFRPPSKVEIFGEYPNLEILSLRKNNFIDMWSPYMDSSDKTSEFDYLSQSVKTPTTGDKEKPFPKLKILDISGNSMTNSDFMTLLPKSLYSLDLSDNLFNSLSLKGKGINLLALNLDNNNLKSVKKRYDLSNLHNRRNKYDLYNPYNEYNQYNDEYNEQSLGLELAGLQNLYYLSLSGNKINFIESITFQDTNKLIYLNLSANNINNLHLDIFAGLQSLNVLDLSLNEFEYIPQISSETNISVLSLGCNKIKKIISNAFVQTPKLTKLLLGGNKIDEIDVKAFAHLSVLEKLDLSGNELSSLPEGWTESLTSLEYLDLSNNKFTSLDYLPLTSTLSLIEIYLVLNPIGYLSARYFENVPQNLTINLMQRSNFAHWNSSWCKLT